MKGSRRVVRSLCLIVLLAGCRGGESDRTTQVPPAPVAATAAVPVTILPARPTAEDDLRLETPAAAIESCIWRRNGSAVENIGGGCLPRGNFARGDVITVTIVADGRESTASTTIGNSPPQITGVTFVPPDFHHGIEVTADIQGADPDGDQILYRLFWVVNGEERPWENTQSLAGDRFRRGDRLAVQVVPADGEGEGEPFRSEEIIVPNAPPHFLSTPPEHFQGDTFIYPVHAEDPDGDDLTFAIEEGPAGAGIDASGILTWAVAAGEAGEHRIRINVADPLGEKAVQEFAIRLRGGN